MCQMHAVKWIDETLASHHIQSMRIRCTPAMFSPSSGTSITTRSWQKRTAPTTCASRGTALLQPRRLPLPIVDMDADGDIAAGQSNGNNGCHQGRKRTTAGQAHQTWNTAAAVEASRRDGKKTDMEMQQGL